LDAQFASLEQLVAHEVLDPLHRYPLHDGDGVNPAGAVVHVPTDPETLQASHGAEQAPLQQYPSTQ
jgi:hypothetical protein